MRSIDHRLPVVLRRRRARAAAAVAFVAAARLATLAGAHEGHATPWLAPDSAKTTKNPVAPSAESVERGRKLYAVNCFACHGEKGDGKGPVAVRLGFTAGDLTDSAQMAKEPDGALFWKISTGRDPMPAFSKEKGLTEGQIWDLVNFTRTFTPGLGGGSPPTPKDK